MRKTTIKTQVTFTSIDMVAFNMDTIQLENLVVEVPATAKTEKGIEKLAQQYIDECYKVVKINASYKFTETYEMERNFFMEHAKKVI